MSPEFAFPLPVPINKNRPPESALVGRLFDYRSGAGSVLGITPSVVAKKIDPS